MNVEIKFKSDETFYVAYNADDGKIKTIERTVLTSEIHTQMIDNVLDVSVIVVTWENMENGEQEYYEQGDCGKTKEEAIKIQIRNKTFYSNLS